MNEIRMNISQQSTLMGYNLVESYHATQPKMRLSDKVLVTPEFRKEYDAWLLERFGTKPGMFVMEKEHTMIVHPTIVEQLRRQVAKQFNDSLEAQICDALYGRIK
jgi:hypothetical protein